MAVPAPHFRHLAPGACVDRWHVSDEIAEHYPGAARPMADTIDFRFVNGWVETGDLPCREAWRAALAADAASRSNVDTASGAAEASPSPPPTNRIRLGGEDERVDFSSFRFRPTLVTRWARASVVAERDVAARFEVDTCGALELWVDGRRRLAFAPCTRNRPASATFACALGAGRHEFLVRAVELHERDTDFHFRLRLLDGDGLSSGLDAPIDDARLARLESLLRSLHLERDFHDDGAVVLRAGERPSETVELDVDVGGAWTGSRTLRLPGDAHPASRSLSARLSPATPSATLFTVPPLHAGCIALRVAATLDGVVIERRLGTTLLPPPVALAPTTPLAARKREVLERLVAHGRDEPSRALVLLEAIARDERRRESDATAEEDDGTDTGRDGRSESGVETDEDIDTDAERDGRPEPVGGIDTDVDTDTERDHRPESESDARADRDVAHPAAAGAGTDASARGRDARLVEAEALVHEALRAIDERHDCADFQLLPLLWIRHRHRERLTPATRVALDRSLLGFRYWLDEPGADVMWFWSENHALCFLAAAHVAGHLFAAQTFTNGGRDGTTLSRRAAARLERWFAAIERHGLGEWNSSAYYPIDLIGLLTLVELGPDRALAARAARLCDVVFRLTALHLTGGVPAGSEGRAYEKELLSGPANELGSVAAVAFGGPWYPGHDRASVLFALSDYAPPESLDALLRPPDGRALSVAYAQGLDGMAKLALWKSRHAQLSAVVDHGSGRAGHQQHVVDVQLDAHPMARFWVNHPGELLPWGDGRPAYLAGNGRLPRVAMHDRHAALLFDLPDVPAVPAFTHARVPEAACDALIETREWLFARAGDGYVALFAARGLEPPAERGGGRRERRQHGRRQAWLVVAGGRDVDGDFERFRTVCEALAPTYDEIDGGRLAFGAAGARIAVGFEGAVTLNGTPVAARAFATDGHERIAWHAVGPTSASEASGTSNGGMSS